MADALKSAAERAAEEMCEWLLRHMASQAGEWGEEAARSEATRYTTGHFQADIRAHCFISGARWQHAQSAAVIGALRENLYSREKQINEQKDEIERLRVELVTEGMKNEMS